MPLVPEPDGVRLAELVGTLSYAADLGLGQPMEHCLRQTVIALQLVDLFCEATGEVLAGLHDAAGWDAVLAAEGSSPRLAGSDLDVVLEAMADLVNMKSPYLAGHSRGVADLAGAAAQAFGLPDRDTTTCGVPV